MGQQGVSQNAGVLVFLVFSILIDVMNVLIAKYFAPFLSMSVMSVAREVPILVFSGDSEGMISKWERMQSNHFMYR